MPKRAWIALAIAMALVATGCAKAASSPSGSSGPGTTAAMKPVYGGTLSIGLDAETDGWNPTASEWAGAAYYVAQTIFDPLCQYDAAGQPEPYLAKSVTHSANYKVWTIGLRSGISFSNGQPLNAAAVVLQLTLAKASPLVGQALDPMAKAVAVNDLTVQVDMNEPWVAFPAVLSSQVGFIAAPAQLEKASNKNPNIANQAATQPIGSGPFIMKQWIRNESMTLTANPHYWRGKPYLSGMVFRILTDPTTRLQALQSNEIQFMYTTEASQIKEFMTNKSETEVEQFVNEPAFVMLNTDAAPLNNLDLRLALEYDTNQQQLNQTISLGLGSAATEPYASGSPWYVPSGYPETSDVSKAKQYLADYEAQAHVKGPVKFTLGCTSSGTNPIAMQLVQAQWKQIGIDVNLEYTEQATYINNAIFGDYQANCWTQFGSIDPDLDATWWLSSNAHPDGSPALNFARLSDSKTDAALNIGRTDPNTAARVAAYGDVWKQFAQQAPYIWLGRAPDALLFSPSVHGVGDGTLPGGAKQYPLLHAGVDVPIDQLFLAP